MTRGSPPISVHWETSRMGFLGFELFGVAVLLHVAFVERPAWVQEHVVVCVVFEPDAHARGPIEPEMFPGTPQRLYARDGFRVEVSFEAPLRCTAVHVADERGQPLLVQELFG